MSLYRACVRPVLFRFDPEWVHKRTLTAARLAGSIAPMRALLRAMYAFEDPRLQVTVGDLKFPNPVGLAAGFDKNGVAANSMASIGFGFVEIGSVSAHPSAGNPVRPRLFRFPADEAVVVYYGVPNEGVEKVAARLSGCRFPVPIGINLVETNTGKPAEPEHVLDELALAAKPFLRTADYIALNLSCPNTTGAKGALADPENLKALLQRYAAYEYMPPTFVKIVPTVDPEAIDRILAAIDPFPFVKGIILNHPAGKSYPNLKTPASVLERIPGTMCGRPTREMSNAMIRAWYPRMNHTRHILVGVGSIFTAEDAYQRIRLGATLLELYTGLIYNGPSLVGQINEGLCRLLERDGFKHISEAVGIDSK